MAKLENFYESFFFVHHTHHVVLILQKYDKRLRPPNLSQFFLCHDVKERLFVLFLSGYAQYSLYLSELCSYVISYVLTIGNIALPLISE